MRLGDAASVAHDGGEGLRVSDGAFPQPPAIVMTFAQTRRRSGTARLRPPGGGRYAAIIFDMGGTLIEYENIPWPRLYGLSLDAVRQYLRRSGRSLPPRPVFRRQFGALLNRRRQLIRAQMREYRIGELLRSLLRSAGIRLQRDELGTVADAYYSVISRQASVYADSESTLRAVRDAGYSIGLLSNTCFRVADHRHDLERFGLWRYLDAADFTSTGRYRKPHPDAFRRIGRRLGVPLKRCLYVGDRQYEDVQGAQGVGMTPVLVRRPGFRYTPGLTRSVEIRNVGALRRHLNLD